MEWVKSTCAPRFCQNLVKPNVELICRVKWTDLQFSNVERNLDDIHRFLSWKVRSSDEFKETLSVRDYTTFGFLAHLMFLDVLAKK